MLPLSLTLKNFMSYGDEPITLDFRGMDVICLSGDNGHGKSAILDAITYALWGETRLGKQGHEQLIRLGADEMAVVFDFQLGQTTYRVRRQRSRKSSGQVWEIQAIEDDGSLRPLTGVSTSDTGRVISRLLRMNYDTFLNSAYLKQGRADEFVRQPPMRRKDILGDILDLSRYDELEALARQKMREATERKIDAERALSQIDAVVAEQPEIQAAFEANKAEIAVLDLSAKTLATSIESETLKLALIDSRRKDFDETNRRLVNIASQIGAISKSLKADQDAIASLTSLIEHRQTIEADYQNLQATNAQIESLTTETESLAKLRTSLNTAEQSVKSQERELQYHIKTLEPQITTAQSVLENLPKLQADIAQIAEIDRQITTTKTTIEQLTTNASSVAATMIELKYQYGSVQEKLAKLDERELRLSTQSEKCSICGSPLSDSQIREIAEQCNVERQELEKTIAALKKDGIAVKASKGSVDADIQRLQTEQARLEAEKATLAASEHRLALLAETQNRLPKLQEQLAEAQALLLGDSLAMAEKQQIAELSSQIAPLSDAPQKLRDARECAKSLQPVTHLYAQLVNAEREYQATQTRLDGSNSQIAELEKERERISSNLQDTADLESQAKTLTDSLTKLRSQNGEINEHLRRAQSLQGSLQSRLDQIDKAQGLRLARESELKLVSRDVQLYTELAGAFGKRGVQALIIDSAMPELEHDASDLLQRLSDGAMNLSIQTQRASKTKSNTDEPIETLDIIVSDDLGERSLEMYSGGESFRVSFALRIALSKLLARRAGADLQALVIDEGFGSQDASGREKLVDAIMAIRADFAQIMVITHVDELKDAFSNRIEIVKTPTGSQASVIVGSALG